MLGALKDATGTYGTGLLLVAIAFGVGTIMLLELGTRWSTRWAEEAIKRAGLFSYRGAAVRTTRDMA
jgi:hypothetical protein